MHGYLILDKPSGITSAHAVAKVKRLLKPAKIGHAGTLDPLASGVLPLALGEATKTVSYLMDASKAYEFTVQWGQERDTDDSEGHVTSTSEKRPSEAEITAVLQQFTGNILQMPPDYSALKVDGKRAYDLARQGEAVNLKAREVRVDHLSIIKQAPESTDFLCHCGKGTYIRSLARDMGRKLGCLGYITRLRRTRVGKFDQSRAISLEMLEEILHKSRLGFVQSLESALDDIPAVSIDRNQEACLRHGQTLILPTLSEDAAQPHVALCEGKAVALCHVSARRLKPVRVFNH